MRLLGVGVLVWGACGASHGVGQPVDGASPDVPAIDASNADAAWSWQPLISTSWTMAGAGSNGSWGNRCVEIPIAQEMWIDGFRPTADMGSGNDHQILMITPQVVPDGSCQDTLADQASMIYASGLGPNEQLTLPAGNAVHLVPGSYLLLNSHIVDDTPNTISGTSGVDVHVVADSSTVAHDVDMVLGGEAAIDVPHNDTPYLASGICAPTPNAGDQWNIVTLWPHMHESGTHAKISIQNVANGPVTTVLDTDYSFMNEQFYSTIDPATGEGALVDTQGKLSIDCTMQNAGPLDLHYDEAEPEFAGGTVCWTGIYKYPTGGTPHQCVEGL